MRRPHETGLTLIEMLIAITVLGILIVVAAPSYTIWINNARIRTAADALLNGLHLARAEAIRTNSLIEFAVTTGTAWSVTKVSDNSVVQSRAAGEGSSNVTSAFTPIDASIVTFNGMGRVTANADGSPSITQIDLDVPTTVLAANDSRNLTLTINSFGQIRLCDPNVSTVGDPRTC